MLKDEQTDFALRAIPENEPIAGLPISCRVEKITAHATRIAYSQERTHRPAHRAATLAAIAQVYAAPTPRETNHEEEPALDQAA